MVKITRGGKNLEFVILKVHMYSIGKGGMGGTPQEPSQDQVVCFRFLPFPFDSCVYYYGQQ